MLGKLPKPSKLSPPTDGLLCIAFSYLKLFFSLNLVVSLFFNYSFRLVDASRKLDTTEEAATLRSIANHLRRLGTVQQACDILRRLEDHSTLAAILVETGAWTEALALVKQHPSLNRDVYLPYARWLAEQEKFIEAQQGWLLFRVY